MNNSQITIKIYEDAVKEAYPKVKNYIFGEISDSDYLHIVDIATSVMLTRDNILQGGSFVQSIVKNNLEGAFCRADSVCERAIKFFIYCNSYIHPKI